MKKTKWILSAAAVCMTAVVAVGVVTAMDVFSSSNLWNAPEASETAVTGKTQPRAKPNSYSEGNHIIRTLLEGQKTVPMSQSATASHFSYTALSYAVAKSNEYAFHYNLPPYLELNDKKDILNGYSYLTVEVTIENLSESTQTLYMSQFGVYLFDNHSFDEATGEPSASAYCEIRGYNKNFENDSRKDYNVYSLAGGETQTIQVLFTFTDQALAEYQDIYLAINPGGGYPVSEDIRFIKLEKPQ